MWIHELKDQVGYPRVKMNVFKGSGFSVGCDVVVDWYGFLESLNMSTQMNTNDDTNSINQL
jgi:hypothetical protein